MPCIPVKQTPDTEQLQARLKELAIEISSDLSELEEEQGKALLSDFVSDLFLTAAKQRQQRDRRQKQASGIAAAKAKGVRFGRPAKPLPGNFDEVRQSWRRGELTLTQAANTCGLPESTFYNSAVRRENAAAK